MSNNHICIYSNITHKQYDNKLNYYSSFNHKIWQTLVLDFGFWSDSLEVGCAADFVGLGDSFWLVGWEGAGLLDTFWFDGFIADGDWLGPCVDIGPLLKFMTGIGSAISSFGALMSSCNVSMCIFQLANCMKCSNKTVLQMQHFNCCS